MSDSVNTPHTYICPSFQKESVCRKERMHQIYIYKKKKLKLKFSFRLSFGCKKKMKSKQNKNKAASFKFYKANDIFFCVDFFFSFLIFWSRFVGEHLLFIHFTFWFFHQCCTARGERTVCMCMYIPVFVCMLCSYTCILYRTVYV